MTIFYIVFALAILTLIGMMVIPLFNTNSLESTCEISALHCINAIRAAEVMYHAKYNKYGTLRELGEAGLLIITDIVKNTHYSHRFECIAGNTTYIATAIPYEPEIMMAYRMTQTGVLEIKRPGESEFKRFDAGE